MNIVHALLGEHGILKFQIDALRRAAKAGKGELRAAALALGEAVESHARLEDELLFEPLEAGGRMPAGPIGGMRAEHAQIEELISRIESPAGTGAEAGASVAPIVARLCDTLLLHFTHEEHVLFVLAARFAGEAELEELGARWAERRSVEIGRALASHPA